MKPFYLLFTLCALASTPAQADEAVDAMIAAANRFIAVLDDDQKKDTLFAWGDDKRQGWHFLPDKFIKPDRRRYGLRLDKMEPDQRAMAQALVSSALSSRGVLEASTIQAFEQLLHEMENKNPIRNPEWFYVSIFGTPAEGATWSWRFEGHHLSVNITIVDGKHISATPSFFAANPGLVTKGPLKGLKLLGDEEDLARALIISMNEEQRKKAIFMDKAPRDIYTGESRKVDMEMFKEVKGIAYSDLNQEQQKQLLAVIDVFTKKYRPEVLKNVNAQGVIADTSTMTFAWAGSLKEGEGHYYRIQTKEHLLEYDNVQNGARHVHAVWREFDGDFGEDLLKAHHHEHHNK